MITTAERKRLASMVAPLRRQDYSALNNGGEELVRRYAHEIGMTSVNAIESLQKVGVLGSGDTDPGGTTLDPNGEYPDHPIAHDPENPNCHCDECAADDEDRQDQKGKRMKADQIVQQLKSMAEARAASTGKSYSVAYAEVMRENPKLYVDYLVAKGQLKLS